MENIEHGGIEDVFIFIPPSVMFLWEYGNNCCMCTGGLVNKAPDFELVFGLWTCWLTSVCCVCVCALRGPPALPITSLSSLSFFQSIGKGSLWSIDPEYRHNLIQALKKTPYHPYSPGLATPSTSPPTLPQTFHHR